MGVGPAGELLRDLPLLDAHCHALFAELVDAENFERCITEAARLGPPGVSSWDSPAGRAIRRWCAPLLELPPFASPADYLDRRASLGLADVTSRLMRGAKLSHLLVDTGLTGPALSPVETLADASGAEVQEVVRLERVAEEVAMSGVTPESFAAAFVERLAARTERAVAIKSIVAYRHGLDIEPVRPDATEIRDAAAQWLRRAVPRLDDPVLLRFVLWTGADLGLPLQLHTGFGDRDAGLRRSDPSLLQPLLEALEPTGVPVVLLHGYPYHRQAGWLATVYAHVYLDVGLTVGQVGAQAEVVLGECLDLAPPGKLLFSTDGYRLPELYLVGAAQFRLSLGRLLDRWVADGDMSADDATRAARMIGAENARRIYIGRTA